MRRRSSILALTLLLSICLGQSEDPTDNSFSELVAIDGRSLYLECQG